MDKKYFAKKYIIAYSIILFLLLISISGALYYFYFKDSNNIKTQQIKEEHTLEITSKFLTGVFFDPKNDFKSELSLNFSDNFYTDIGEEGSDEFIQNRLKAKKDLLKLITITPKVDLKEENITFYPNKAILNLNLKELTEYKISLKGKYFNQNKKLLSSELNFTTPDSKYLKFFIQNPVSLYKDTTPPKFEIVEYKTDLKNLTFKICRVDNESYVKIEQLREQTRHPESRDFFVDKIDDLPVFECFKKEIVLKNKIKNGSIVQNFDFDDIIGKPAHSGLYFVTFDDKKLRDINGVQYARFFGIVNSHLTMKISKNGEGFFFVNDFSGKPLANQKIISYKTDFQLFSNEWNDKIQDMEKKYFDVIKKQVLSKPIELGTTDKNGLLIVDLNKSFKGAFDMTFADWWLEDEQGQYPSLFVTSASNTHLTYNSSRWNSGIAPFNFGYKISDYWWGEEEKDDKIELDRWAYHPNYLSHTFTDRVLYLPGEEVYIKSIIRQTPNLNIVKNKEFNIKITNPKGEEVFNQKVKSNNFGNINNSYKLPQIAKLGNYYISLMDGDDYIGNTSFSVEIFQNPKFKNDIILKTIGITNDLFEVKDKKKLNKWDNEFSGNFEIKGDIISTYFNGSPLKNADVEYKVYKQVVYDYSYYDDCYYGCFYEGEKEFYTEGTTKTDEFGKSSFSVKIDHKTTYYDYKYIVEVTATDYVGDKITSANSVLVKLPVEYKTWDSSSSISLNSDSNFYELGKEMKLTPLINKKPWDKNYDNKYVVLIKKKDFETEIITDTRGVKKPINKQKETILDIKYITGNISYIPKETGEYIFEYGFIVDEKNIKNIIENKDFTNFKNEYLTKRDFKSIIIYGDKNASNPITNDNKLQVLSDKVSYKIGEKAQILIRLPFSKGKILLTTEKSKVEKYEYIDVNSNIFFKEIVIDDSFIPNAYIGVLAFDTENLDNPYRVGYTEIVVDKTDKKSFIEITPNKTTYKPREKVNINLEVKDSKNKGIESEITLMVIDDSLISLLGNIDLNLIDKFFKKLPFQIQTSLTNVVMLQNNYFSRPGIVGGSGFGSFKGGDSAVSTRTIFKNTAYYNPSIITDKNGKTQVSFELPDNITNFRIIALSNSKNNTFGTKENFIEVKKNVVVEPKTPIITRNNDLIKIPVQIFNTTNNDIGFKVEFKSDDFTVKNSIQNVIILGSQSQIVYFEIQNKTNKENLYYTVSALGDSVDNSDKFEGVIKLATDPILISQDIKKIVLKDDKTQSINFDLGDNTSIKNSKIILKVASNKLSGIEKIVSSLAVYPYGCIEQTTSLTLPNVILKSFGNIFSGIVDKEKIEKNINYGIERILSMQQDNGGFAYWPGETSASDSITPYVLRSLLEIQNNGYTDNKNLNNAIFKAKNYLEQNTTSEDDVIDSQKAWALAMVKSNSLKIEDIKQKLTQEISNIARIGYTYSLVLSDKAKYKKEIDNSILTLKKTINNIDNNSYRYWDNIGTKAIFTQMLLDYNYKDFVYIDSIIDELYDIDWNSYYYSTQTKNNAFMAFSKYLQKTNINSKTKVKYSFNDKKYYAITGEENPNFFRKEYELKDIFNENNKIKINFDMEVGKVAYIEAIFEKYPENLKLIKPYSNKIKITKQIFEVNTNGKEKEITNNIFKKGNLYRVVLSVKTDDNKKLRNLVIEDYQGAGFKQVNEKLKITSNTYNNNRYFDYKEQRPEVLFLNSSYNYGDLSYNYLFHAEYAGKFTLPPVSAYLMYNPEERVYNQYNAIEIVE